MAPEATWCDRFRLVARRLIHPLESVRLLLPCLLPVRLRGRLLGAFSLRTSPPPLPRHEGEVQVLLKRWLELAACQSQERVTALPPVSIVVVTFGNCAFTRLCLESIRIFSAGLEYEVIVVDNGSGDGTIEMVEQFAAAHGRVRLIANERNLGFAAAINVGVRAARGQILCLLNNDTIVTPGWLPTLAGAVWSDPGLGMVGPVTNAVGNEARIRVGYRTLADLPVWATRRAARDRDQAFEIPMLALFCTVLRREVWERTGELDEQFGAGMFEDDDYSRRVRAAGLDLQCRRDVFVHHWQRAGFKLLGDEVYARLYEENRARFLAKWGK